MTSPIVKAQHKGSPAKPIIERLAGLLIPT
jgi:hypothetical protein